MFSLVQPYAQKDAEATAAANKESDAKAAAASNGAGKGKAGAEVVRLLHSLFFREPIVVRLWLMPDVDCA